MKLTGAAPPPPLAIHVATVDPGTVTVAVTGEVDMLTAAELQAALTVAMESHRPRSLVVDMAGVPFLDAAGMSGLIQAHHHAGRLGVDLLLVNVSRQVFRSLRVVGLVGPLHITPHP